MQDTKQLYLDFFSSELGAAKYSVFKETVYGKDDLLVSELFDRLVPFLPKKEYLNILDVGGGDGKRLKKIISLLKDRGFIVSATIIEPSKAFFHSLLLSSDFKKSKIKLRPLKFEDFLTAEKFDLIFLVHSIGEFIDKQDILKISSLLASGGKVFVVLNGSDSLVNKIKNTVFPSSIERNSVVGSVVADFESEGFGASVFSWRVSYSGIFDSTGFTHGGQRVMEVLALNDFNKIPQSVLSQSLSLFLNSSKNGVVSDSITLIVAEK